ncbi:MAG: anthranilate synthase component I family protein [Kiritimatiellae bacterium]|nr:anthranilate synthase component I family protein [Kiritimatiellia bacterium]
MLKILSEEEFNRRAEGAGRVAVFKEFLADRETPVAALSRLDDDEEAFLLESVAGGETRGRYSYLGIEPSRRIEGEDSLREIKERFKAMRYAAAPELPSFQGGAVGYVAYDAVDLFEPKVKLRHEEGTPRMAFLMCDAFLVFDNVRDTVTVVVVADTSRQGAYSAAMDRIQAIYDRILSAESIARLMDKRAADGNKPKVPPQAHDVQPEMTKDEFCEMVAKCKAAIKAGEVIQIVPSQKFTVETGVSGLSLYRALRTINPSPYNFFMRIGPRTLIGSSPEELVKLSGRTASTAPIAGTRPRGDTPLRDAELERDLKADPKENAEHTMLVDLGRNDLGRVCETGSVKVEGFAHVERYSHVMHLVSNVTGTLERDRDGFDLLRATFPAGTLSGAPKVRAMELIAEYEKSPRGIYGGAAGYFSLTGDMDFAIVIRTLVREDGRVTMRSGAGIVADSSAEKEYEETINKAKAVFEAVRFAEELQ